MSATPQVPVQPPAFQQILRGAETERGTVLPSGPSSFASVLHKAAVAVWTFVRQGNAAVLLSRRQRRLRVSETLSLGDKRFVSILEVDGQAFLLGSSGASLVLLASLAPDKRTCCSPSQDSLDRGSMQ